MRWTLAELAGELARFPLNVVFAVMQVVDRPLGFGPGSVSLGGVFVRLAARPVFRDRWGLRSQAGSRRTSTHYLERFTARPVTRQSVDCMGLIPYSVPPELEGAFCSLFMRGSKLLLVIISTPCVPDSKGTS